MSLRRALLTAVLASSALLSACALRPRYAEVVAPPSNVASAAGTTVALRVVDPATNRPVPGARVLAGDTRSRMSATADADGVVKFEVTPELLKENPLVEVVLPSGVRSYRLELMPSGQAPAAPTAPETPAPSETPATPESPASPGTPTTPESPSAPQSPSSPSTPGTAT
jgi:hypothetical protein